MAEAARVAAEAAQRAQIVLEEVRGIYASAVRVGGSGGSGSGTSSTLKELQSIIDTKILTKVDIFDGSDARWPEWSFVFESSCSLIELEDLMEAACKVENEDCLKLENNSAIIKLKSKALSHLLIQVVGGKALNSVRTQEKHNGFLAWRILKKEYEPSTGGRFTSMLISLLQPGWDEQTPFDQQLIHWEKMVTDYTTQSKKPVGDALKIAVLTKQSPEAIKGVVRNNSGAADGDYAKLRKAIFDYVASGKDYTEAGVLAGPVFANPPPIPGGGAQPMDVGAIDKKGGGKGQFQGNCSKCGYWGHKAADCRSNPNKRKKVTEKVKIKEKEKEDSEREERIQHSGRSVGIVRSPTTSREIVARRSRMRRMASSKMVQQRDRGLMVPRRLLELSTGRVRVMKMRIWPG